MSWQRTQFGVQDGLHDALVVEGAGAPRRRRQRLHRLGQRQAGLAQRRAGARVVAADATALLARLELDHAAHALQLVEVLVQQVEVEHLARRER